MAVRVEYDDGEEEVLEDGYSWRLKQDFVVITDGGGNKLKMVPKDNIAAVEAE